ncbi:MAG: hypothetical protein NTV34_14255 [Proteobacteria bacterium]|nr:hypothetical protein [Pseudomonadota bacterium]
MKVPFVIDVIVAGILVYADLRKREVKIFWDLVIAASPEALFLFINNGQRSDEWMPWKDSDPGVALKYSGPAEGVVATSLWESTVKMGTDQAVNIGSAPNKSVKTQQAIGFSRKSSRLDMN